jgi:serine/threonine-protein kinase
VQDGTPAGRYQLLECIGRSATGETWRAFDNLTQRVVAVTVLADDGGDTVVQAPVLDYPAYGPQSGSIVEYRAYWPGGTSPANPTRDGQAQQDDQKPSGPKKSRKHRLIVLSSAAAIAVTAAVVAAVVLIGPGRHGGAPQASSTSASPAAPANTGPLTGTFTVHMDQAYLVGGTPDQAAEAKPWTEAWQFRSACSANGCVATAAGGDHADVSSLVFDNVGGRWFAVGLSQVGCHRPTDDEAWNVISLAPQPDGTLSGESTRATTNGCFIRRNVTLTRKGDTDISKLPDPTHLDPRAVSPAEALHGRYDVQTTYASGYKTPVENYGVLTNCLRTGDRCMSYFIATNGTSAPFVFANGVWTLNKNYTNTCSSGGKHPATYTETIALPEPPQDPITSLVSHGYENVPPGSGVTCPSQGYDETFTRTGD